MSKDLKYLGGAILVAIILISTIHATAIVLMGVEQYDKVKGLITLFCILLGIVIGIIAAEMRSQDG